MCRRKLVTNIGFEVALLKKPNDFDLVRKRSSQVVNRASIGQKTPFFFLNMADIFSKAFVRYQDHTCQVTLRQDATLFKSLLEQSRVSLAADLGVLSTTGQGVQILFRIGGRSTHA